MPHLALGASRPRRRIGCSLRQRAELASRLHAPLVGRHDTFAQLEWALERTVSENGCRLVTVVGTPGIGKSRHEFVARLGERATVLQGRCLPYGEGITFWALAEMVRQAAAIHEADGGEDAVAKLEALLAPAEDARAVAEAIAQLAGLVETRGVVEEGFWAVRRLFARLARDRPLVVMLDDAHWAEPMLLALVENVTRHTELVPILVVCLSGPTCSSAARTGVRRPSAAPSSGSSRSTTQRVTA